MINCKKKLPGNTVVSLRRKIRKRHFIRQVCVMYSGDVQSMLKCGKNSKNLL